MVDRSIVAERFVAQGLAGSPATSVPAVAERLLAVQAQDLRGARLAVRARSEGLASSDVDRALSVDRSVVVTWLNRGTLHLVRTEDLPWLHAVTTPPLTNRALHRLGQLGTSPDAADRGVAVIERALGDAGPLTRGQLRERVGAAGVRVEGQALVHLLFLASLRRIVIRGPLVGAEQAFVRVHDWIGPLPAADRERALAELARRFLVGHGPADDRDLARWAGIPLRDARAGLRAIGAELNERAGGLVALAPPSRRLPEPAPRLLGPFEPVLLGWVSRDEIVGPRRSLVTVNGLFRPFALVRGRAVAIWRLRGGSVALEPFEPVGPDDQRALDRDAADVRRFLGRGSSS